MRTTPLERSTRRAQSLLKVRSDAPMRVPPDQSETAAETRARAASGSRPASSRVTRVRWVPKTKASVRTPATRRSAMAKRMRSASVPLHGAAHVADHRHGARSHERPAPEPLGEVATALQVAAEHLARRQASPVAMQAVAPRAAHLETWVQAVDESLRIAQLGRAHAFEGLVEEPFELAPGGRQRSLVAQVGRAGAIRGLVVHGDRGGCLALGLLASLKRGHALALARRARPRAARGRGPTPRWPARSGARSG